MRFVPGRSWVLASLPLAWGATVDLSTRAATTASSLTLPSFQQRPAPRAPGQAETCGRADPSYIHVANETGGQPLFFKRSEAGKVGPFIQGTWGNNRELLLWATGTLHNGPRHFELPIDSAVEQVAVTLSVDAEDSTLTLSRPAGIPVRAGDATVESTHLACSHIVMVRTPDAGTWHVDVTGSGSFWIKASARTDLHLTKAEFVRIGGRPGHEGLFQIAGQPLAGSPGTLQVRLSGPVQTTTFSLLSLDGGTIKRVGLNETSAEGDDREYVGNVDLPEGPFRVAASGEDASGWPYRRVFAPLFHAETVEVVPVDAAGDDLRSGATSSIQFKIRNIGKKETFRIIAVDSRHFVSRVDPQELTLASGASAHVTVDLTIPPDASTPSGCDVTITATSASKATTNSAVRHLELVPAHP